MYVLGKAHKRSEKPIIMRSTRLRNVPNVAFETIPAELPQTTEQVTVKLQQLALTKQAAEQSAGHLIKR